MYRDPWTDYKLIAQVVVTLIIATLAYRYFMLPQIDAGCLVGQLVDGDLHHCSRLYRLFGI